MNRIISVFTFLALTIFCFFAFCSCSESNESKNAKLSGYERTVSYGNMSFYEMLDVYAAEQVSEEYDDSNGTYKITVEDGWQKADDVKDKELLLNDDEKAYTYTIVLDGICNGEQVRETVRFFCKLIEKTNTIKIVELYGDGDTVEFISDSSEIDDIMEHIFPKDFPCIFCVGAAVPNSDYCENHKCRMEGCLNGRYPGRSYCDLHQ